MNIDTAARLMRRIDGSGSEEENISIRKLERALGDRFPEIALLSYRTQRSWKARCVFVYEAVKYAQRCPSAVVLGLEALNDKSKKVRYRACELLAYSQNPSILTEMNMRLRDLKGNDADDLRASIDAIEGRNHNYFFDREHSGCVFRTYDIDDLPCFDKCDSLDEESLKHKL